MSTQNKIREAQEAIGSIYDLSQQLEREGTVAEWWTEANTEAIVKATEALAALSELDAQPSAPTVDEVMDVVKQWGERYYYEGYLSDLRARLTKLLTNP